VNLEVICRLIFVQKKPEIKILDVTLSLSKGDIEYFQNKKAAIFGKNISPKMTAFNFFFWFI